MAGPHFELKLSRFENLFRDITGQLAGDVNNLAGTARRYGEDQYLRHRFRRIPEVWRCAHALFWRGHPDQHDRRRQSRFHDRDRSCRRREFVGAEPSRRGIPIRRHDRAIWRPLATDGGHVPATASEAIDRLAAMPVEERDRRLRQRFDEIDTNHDGKLDEEEVASHVNHLRGN